MNHNIANVRDWRNETGLLLLLVVDVVDRVLGSTGFEQMTVIHIRDKLPVRLYSQ